MVQTTVEGVLNDAAAFRLGEHRALVRCARGSVRVVNDRRRLPRVAWTGVAVIHSRRGEVQCQGLDVSANGMAVIAASPGKTRDRVRVHAQLGSFPLLSEATIVRMTKTREGYRWALRFERLDQQTRVNLEAFVSHQLAAAARVRQAQLYAARMKSASLLPSFEPNLAPPVPVPVPVPAPATPVDTALAAEVEAVAQPPTQEPTGQPVHAIDLPKIPTSVPLEVGRPLGAHTDPGPPSAPQGYGSFEPYTPEAVPDEDALLAEGPLVSSRPARPDPTLVLPDVSASTPASPPAPPERPVDATVMLPDQGPPAGVYQIEEDSDLSLEDILNEVEGGATPAAVPVPAPEDPSTPKMSPGGTMIVEEEPSNDGLNLALSGATVTVTVRPPSPDEPPDLDATTVEPSAAAKRLLKGEDDAGMGAVLPPPLDAEETVALERELPALSIRDADELDEDEQEPQDEGNDPPMLFDARVDLPEAEDHESAMMGVPFDAGMSLELPPPDFSTPVPQSADPRPQDLPDPLRTRADAPTVASPTAASPAAEFPTVDAGFGALESDSESVSFADADRVDELRAPTLVEEPEPSIFPDEAAAYEPYKPYDAKSQPTPAPHDVGSKPSASPQLPPPVEGLYTPVENPSLDEHSGAYERASFEPFPSPTEHDLYAESTVSFEEQRDDPRLRLASLQRDVKAAKELPAEHSMYLGDIEGVTTNLTPTGLKRAMTDESLPVVPFDEPHSIGELGDIGAPSAAASAPTRPLRTDNIDRTDGPHDPQASASGQRGAPTDPGFHVVPDFDAGFDRDRGGGEPEGPQTGGTVVVADSRMVDLLRAPEADEGPEVAAEPSSNAASFAAMPSFGGQGMAGFTMVAGFEDSEPGAGGTMVATAEQVESWKAAKAPFDDDSHTSAFTPAPTDPEPTTPRAVPRPFDDGAATQSFNQAELIAMRVTAGSGGEGFQLNPRGPAPAPAPAPAAIPLVADSAPGPSPRRGTDIDNSGGPAPAPAPTVPEKIPEPVRKVPPLRGSGPIDDLPTGSHKTVPQAAAKPSTRRDLIEDALAQLKRKTDEKRRQRGDDAKPEAEKAEAEKAEAKPMKGKRRRTMSRAQAADPVLRELFQAALTDIEGKRE